MKNTIILFFAVLVFTSCERTNHIMITVTNNSDYEIPNATYYVEGSGGCDSLTFETIPRNSSITRLWDRNFPEGYGAYSLIVKVNNIELVSSNSYFNETPGIDKCTYTITNDKIVYSEKEGLY